ncbi:5'-methylthioadenosine/adenosylhomocysteine nucleosidase [Dubosiella newyorkensis]|uniref:5'-methylthioadenosine/adenosylhomocysteine nucleosidase n=1 Tax=Dubosiella newyorkensis TaxID=1862672 RepID=UPI0032B24E23
MIGILCAMESELQAILKYMEIESERQIATCKLYRGKIHEQEVIACLAGIGKCSASMSATILLMEAPVELVINVGVAGGLLENQQVLDLVISNEAIQADFDTSPLDGEEGLGLRYPIEPALIQKAESIAQKIGIPYQTGVIATQDLFMARQSDFDTLKQNFPESACSEMEGGAIAQVCSAFHTPCLIIRTLSDVVFHHDNPMEFSAFAKKASEQAAKFINEWCL